MKIRVCLLFLMLITSGASVHAEESQWGVGLVALGEDEGYVDIGSETNIFPVVFYRGENFYWLGPRAGYTVGEFDGVEINLIGQLRFDGLDPDDAEFYAGMEERDPSFDLGIELEYATELGDFGLTVLQDITSTHEGFEVALSLSKGYRAGRGLVTPYLEFAYYSDDLVDYYYGVRSDEARAGRAAYQGSSTTNVEFGIDSMWQLAPQHQLIANVGYTLFGNGIKDSSIVDASGSAQLLLGYLYVF